jgi:hypothetical protein
MAFLAQKKGTRQLRECTDLLSVMITIDSTGSIEIKDSTKVVLTTALLKTTSQEILDDVSHRLESRYGLTLEEIMVYTPGDAHYMWTEILPNAPVLLWNKCNGLMNVGGNVSVKIFTNLLNHQKDILAAEFKNRFEFNIACLKPADLIPEAYPLLDKLFPQLNLPSYPVVTMLNEWRTKRNAEVEAARLKVLELKKTEEATKKKKQDAVDENIRQLLLMAYAEGEKSQASKEKLKNEVNELIIGYMAKLGMSELYLTK